MKSDNQCSLASIADLHHTKIFPFSVSTLMSFLPRLVFAVTLPLVMTTNVVAGGMQPPVPKSAVILRDPKASDHVQNRKLNLEAGVYVNSEAYLSERGTQTNRDLYILRATQGVEGGFDSVNIYDRGVLSWGVMQWAAHENSLQECLAYIKGRLLDKNRGRVWASLFKEHGLDIQEGPGGSSAFFVGGPLAWRPVTGIPNLRVLFRGTRTVGKYDPATAAKWAQVFARAGRNREVQALQTEWAVRNVRRCLSQSVDGDLSASDFTHGDIFSDALLFALWTNNPAASRTHFARAVRETRRITGETSPSRWPQGLFPFVWERVGRTSRFGAWPKRTVQIAASVPAGETGRRAAKTHLAALGWKPERIGTETGASGRLWKRDVYVAAPLLAANHPAAPLVKILAAAVRQPTKPALPGKAAPAAKAFATGAITLPRTPGAPSEIVYPAGRAAVFVRAYGPVPPAPVRRIPVAATRAAVKPVIAATSPKPAAVTAIAAKPGAPSAIPAFLAARDRKTPSPGLAAPSPAPKSPLSPIAVVAVHPSVPFVIVINKPAAGDAAAPKTSAASPLAKGAAALFVKSSPLATKTDKMAKPAAPATAFTGAAIAASPVVVVAPKTTIPQSVGETTKVSGLVPAITAAPKSTTPPDSRAGIRAATPVVVAAPTPPMPSPVVSATPPALTAAVPAPFAPLRAAGKSAPAAPSAAPVPTAPLIATRAARSIAPLEAGVVLPAAPRAAPLPNRAVKSPARPAAAPSVGTPAASAPTTPVLSPIATPNVIAPTAPKTATAPLKTTPAAESRSGGVLTVASTLSFTGFGAVRVGMTRAEAERAANDTFLPVGPSASAGSGGGTVRPQHGPAGVQFIVQNDKIVRVDLLPGCDAQTASGVRVGDTIASLRERYPENLLSSALHPTVPGGHILTLRARTSQFAAFRVMFETDVKGRVIVIRAGRAQ